MRILDVKPIDINNTLEIANDINDHFKALDKKYVFKETGEICKVIETKKGNDFKRLSNFFIIPLSISELLDSNNNEVDIVYKLKIIIVKFRKSYTVELLSSEYHGYKWLKEIPHNLLLELPYRDSYRELQELIDLILSDVEMQAPYFKNIGWHKVNNKYYYIHSKGAIGEDGASDTIGHSILNDYCLNFDVDNTVEDEKKAFKLMIHTLKIGDLKSIVPIFSVTLLSLIITPLKQVGISPDLLLWIDAETSSGKTELALLFSAIFNRGKKNNQDEIKKNMMLAIDKPKDVLKKYYDHKDCVFILDDVNRSKGAKSRESIKENVTLLTRIIGNRPTSGENTSQSLAIITGEFLDEIKSSISRYFYIKMDNFFTDEKRSKRLTQYQENNIFLSNFIFFYIKWLAGKLNNGLTNNTKEKLLEFRKTHINEHKSRINDTMFYMQYSNELLIQYAYEKGFLSQDFGIEWYSKTNEILNYWVRILDYLVLDEATLFLDYLKKAVISGKILIEYCRASSFDDAIKKTTRIKKAIKSFLDIHGIFIESENEPNQLIIDSDVLYLIINEIKIIEESNINEFENLSFSKWKMNKELSRKGIIHDFLRSDSSSKNHTVRYDHIYDFNNNPYTFYIKQIQSIMFNTMNNQVIEIIDEIKKKNPPVHYNVNLLNAELVDV